MKITNQMFIVSGGSSGLGLATVTDLLMLHAYILIIDLKPPNEDLKLTLSHVKFFQTDITKVDEIEKAVEGTVAWSKEMGGALAGVVNCAGVGLAGKVSGFVQHLK
jgi:phosphoribosylaminoimidazolecarboxamide formyltransferase/IMP cyclohydrolase